MRTVLWILILLGMFILSRSSAAAQDVLEEVTVVPEGISDERYEELIQQKEVLDSEREALSSEIDEFNADCGGVLSSDEAKLADCRTRQEAIEERITAYNDALSSYETVIDEAEAESEVMQVKNYSKIKVQEGIDDLDIREELLDDFSVVVNQRTVQPNPQASQILQALGEDRIPDNIVKDFSDLKSGDVILVGTDPVQELSRREILDAVESYGIRFVDRLSSWKWDSPASHTAIFLKEYNGELWFLDNTTEAGTVIISEKEMLRRYSHRLMNVASVEQPLSQEEGQKLWEAAKEISGKRKHSGIIDRTNYGIIGSDNMVCSEVSRWLLLQAGRDIPETASPLKKIVGVNYGPGSFYENDQYFIVTPLMMVKPGPSGTGGDTGNYDVDQGHGTYKGKGINP